MIVRYEDLAERPEEIVPKMYDFVGLQLPSEIKTMIEDLNSEKPENSQAWREKLNINQVLRIQQLCSDRVFNLFGYAKVKNVEELKNKDISLLLPLPE